MSLSILKSVVSLTNDQVKALPTAGVTVVAAAPSGKWARIHTATISVVLINGYSNIDPTLGAIVLCYSSNQNNMAASGIFNESGTGITTLTDFLAAGNQVASLVPTPFTDSHPSNWGLLSRPLAQSVLNASDIKIIAGNNGAGNFLGGNVSNQFKVTVNYSLEDL